MDGKHFLYLKFFCYLLKELMCEMTTTTFHTNINKNTTEKINKCLFSYMAYLVVRIRVIFLTMGEISKKGFEIICCFLMG